MKGVISKPRARCYLHPDVKLSAFYLDADLRPSTLRTLQLTVADVRSWDGAANMIDWFLFAARFGQAGLNHHDLRASD